MLFFTELCQMYLVWLDKKILRDALDNLLLSFYLHGCSRKAVSERQNKEIYFCYAVAKTFKRYIPLMGSRIEVIKALIGFKINGNKTFDSYVFDEFNRIRNETIEQKIDMSRFYEEEILCNGPYDLIMATSAWNTINALEMRNSLLSVDTSNVYDMHVEIFGEFVQYLRYELALSMMNEANDHRYVKMKIKNGQLENSGNHFNISRFEVMDFMDFDLQTALLCAE